MLLLLLEISLLFCRCHSTEAFVARASPFFISTPPTTPSSSTTALWVTEKKCTPLPSGLSPFEKGAAKSLDIAGSFRKIAASAVDRAIRDGVPLLEIDFPPFAGDGKSQFDDYDNIQELNANRDWCVQLVPLLKSGIQEKAVILPDDKECELAAQEWTGQLYRNKNTGTQFTSIRAACETVCGAGNFRKAWGSNLAETVNKLQGGDGILVDDSSTIDTINADAENRLQLVCQPGNGGPVEDWINVELLHRSSSDSTTTCIVNGALDKVRDGYYAAVFFPALAKTIPFYRQFEPVFIVKPVSDKGVYGWMFRVYPEPWQVILQTARQTEKAGVKVQETVALLSEERPTYAQAVDALLRQQQAAATQ